MPRWIDVNKSLPETKKGAHAKQYIVACIRINRSNTGTAKFSKKDGGTIDHGV